MQQFIKSLLTDPPPGFVFEVSEAGIATARVGRPPQLGFRPIEPDVLAVSPVKDNVLRPEALAGHVKALAPPEKRGKRRHRAVLVLPDWGVRVTVLDFDQFPSDSTEQRALVRFRLKKSLPFDLDSASLSYVPQPAGADGKVDVVVAVAPIEVVARYEAPFRAAGFHTGVVTSSTLACLDLLPAHGVAVLVKLSRRILTISVLSGRVLKLLRCLEVGENGMGEIAGHLYPTFAFAEDHLGTRPEHLYLCGFGPHADEMRRDLARDLEVEAALLRSRFGVPDEYNSGLLGYLEQMELAA